MLKKNKASSGRAPGFSFAQVSVIFLIRTYQVATALFRPILVIFLSPAQCRFSPTCSQYCLDAVKTHGTLAGLILGAKRIARCHPGNPGGHDPVPSV